MYKLIAGEESEILLLPSSLPTNSLLEFLVLLPQLVHTVNHLLDELNLGVSQPVLVGDVVSVSSLSTRLAAGSARLQVQLLAASLEFVDGVLGPAGEVDVDGGPHAGTEVGGAGVDVTVLGIEAEVLARLLLDGVLDTLDTLGEPLEDTLDISTLLHGDDSELILLVDPDKECLLSVVEDTTTLGPVSLHTGNSQVPISGDKQEVVVDQLLAHLLVHASQGVVITGQVFGEVLDSVGHQLLNSNTLLLGDSRGQTEAIDGATDTNPAGVDGSVLNNIALDLVDIHIGGVLGRGADSVVFLDQRVEDGSEVLV